MTYSRLLRELGIFLNNSTNSHDCIEDARKILRFLEGETNFYMYETYAFYDVRYNTIVFCTENVIYGNDMIYLGVV